jgi:predicted amidophosphoribosyltransferase
VAVTAPAGRDVRRRALRQRNGISYLTFESWRNPIRTYQIAALKALKQNVPLELSHAEAARMAGEINHFVGLSAFKFIVPVPCGNSDGDSCLSLEIARSLGSLTGLPVLPCLSLPRSGGSSHPKNNLRRPRMSLAQAISGPALLVADVATSGSHIEEATRLLRPTCGAVLAVAWIGT